MTRQAQEAWAQCDELAVQCQRLELQVASAEDLSAAQQLKVRP